MSEQAGTDLKEATLRGVRWVALARVATEVVAFAAMVAMARLVDPAEFGRAAIALIVNALALLVASAGFGTPLVQRPTVERAHLETTAFASLVAGLGLSALTFLLAPVVCDPLFGAATGDLVQLVSPVFTITALGVVSLSILQRQLDFKRISAIETAALAGGSCAAVAFAAAGLGGKAIVLGPMVAACLSTVLLLAGGPRTRPRWHRAEAREILGFGVPAALSSLVNMGVRNVDYAILAARLSPAQVGFYWRGFQLGVEHQRKVSGVMMRMALPVFARSGSVEEMRELRGRIVRVHAAVLFPMLGLLIVLAPTVVPWLLGDRWEPAVVPTQILAVAGMASAVLTGVGPLMFAIGKPRAVLAYNAVSLAVLAGVMLVAAPHGILVASAAAAGFAVVQVLFAHWLLLDRLAGIPMRSVVADVAPALLSCGALAAAALPVAAALGAAGAPAVILLTVAGAAGTAAYLGVLRLVFADAFADLATLVRRVVAVKRPSRPRRVAGAAQTSAAR